MWGKDESKARALPHQACDSWEVQAYKASVKFSDAHPHVHNIPPLPHVPDVFLVPDIPLDVFSCPHIPPVLCVPDFPRVLNLTLKSSLAF